MPTSENRARIKLLVYHKSKVIHCIYRCLHIIPSVLKLWVLVFMLGPGIAQGTLWHYGKTCTVLRKDFFARQHTLAYSLCPGEITLSGSLTERAAQLLLALMKPKLEYY